MGLRRVTAGEELRIPANTWNGLVALLEKQPSKGAGIRERTDPTTCVVKNTTGAALPWLGVIGLNVPLILPSDDLDQHLNGFGFVGVLAQNAGYQYKWGLALEPIADGEYGLVRISGLCHCFISMNPAGGIDFAGPDASGTVGALVSAPCGARVLWRDGGTGPQRAIVIL